MNTTPAANVSPEKAFCFDYLDRNARAIAILNDSIFYFAELGMQETETAKLMSGLLEQGGLTVSGRRLTVDERFIRDEDYLAGRYLLLRKGARDYALVRVN